MRIVITGSNGQIGQFLTRTWLEKGHEIIGLARRPYPSDHPRLTYLVWDGENLGDWASAVDGADVVLNLAGRTVNCRYTPENLKQMMDSRIRSTQVIGAAIEQASEPPALWLQMSTATIYSHRFDAPNDEETGEIGGREPDAPDYWSYSVEIAQRW